MMWTSIKGNHFLWFSMMTKYIKKGDIEQGMGSKLIALLEQNSIKNKVEWVQMFLQFCKNGEVALTKTELSEAIECCEKNTANDDTDTIEKLKEILKNVIPSE